MLLRPGLALLLLTLTAVVHAASVYRWTDAQGQVHFGDRPPQAGAEALPLPQAPASPAVEAEDHRERQQRLLRAFEAERREREEQAAEARRQAEVQERACTEGRDRLRQFRDSAYLYRLDERGERVPLSQEERAATEAELEAALHEHCD